MPISPARAVAYKILRRAESGRGFAAGLLQAAAASELREVDRRLATELVMGVLRWRGELDFLIEELSAKPLSYFDPEVATILRLAIYQVRFLERVPKAAIVNDAVNMVKSARKRSAAGLVNAVLRKCNPPAHCTRAGRFADLTEESQASVIRSLPAWLFDRWKVHFGPDAAQALAFSSVQVPRTTLRVARSEERERIESQLAAEGIAAHATKYSALGVAVTSGNASSSKAASTGRMVIQDEGSQLVASLVAPQPGERVLDLCAAPGIKAGQVAGALASGMLVAADVSYRRLQTMRTLLPKMIPGAVRAYAVRLDADKELPLARVFDRILVDAPCSGTGTLARNPEIKWRLKPEDLVRLPALQASILRNAVAVLAPGGRLVYATCSLEPEENEEVVEKVLRENSGYRLLSAEELLDKFPALHRFLDPVGYFRTRPDVHDMDGFFAAVIVRGQRGQARSG